MEHVVGYLAAGLIGISLGMVGGGGSVLTVPVLVYLFHVEPTLATAYSLFIVGTTSLVGGVQSALRQLVDYRTAVIFAVPSFAGVYLTRRYLVPLLPDEFFSIGSFVVTRDIAIMVFFALLMLGAALSMIRNKRGEGPDDQQVRYNYPMIILEGLVVGAVTGLVGAGGGLPHHSRAGLVCQAAHEESRWHFPGDHCCEVTCGLPRRCFFGSGD